MLVSPFPWWNSSAQWCCALWIDASWGRRCVGTSRDSIHRWISEVYRCIRRVHDASTMAVVGNFCRILDTGSVAHGRRRRRTVCSILLRRNCYENYLLGKTEIELFGLDFRKWKNWFFKKFWISFYSSSSDNAIVIKWLSFNKICYFFSFCLFFSFFLNINFIYKQKMRVFFELLVFI